MNKMITPLPADHHVTVEDSQDDEINFLDDFSATNTPRSWPVLCVDDDADFRRSISFALAGLEFDGRPLELLDASSMAEASTLLAARRDIALVLLDVIMETDDAGLRLISAVREVIGNLEVRIVLVTGQPGMSPVNDVMRDYDVNDYFAKSELSTSRLHTVVTSALRSYQHIHTVSVARRGLQMIVESSNRLLGKSDLKAYSAAALEEIALLLNLPPEGLVCARMDQVNFEESPSQLEPDSLKKVRIISAAGRLANCIDAGLDSLPDSALSGFLGEALFKRTNLETKDANVLFFGREESGADFAVYLATARELYDTERELLRVFAVNVSRGLHNVALVSRLDRLAFSDRLLGLPNRNALMRALSAALLAPGNQRLMLIDLDDFSGANMAFGPCVGDEILRTVSVRLRRAFPPMVMIARINSDVFALLGLKDQLAPAAVTEALSAPIEVAGTQSQVTAAIATVDLESMSGNPDEILGVALLTIKAAKFRGQGSHVHFETAYQERALKRFQTLQALVAAMHANETYLAYQPQIDLASGKVIGVEALMRWTHNGQAVPPDQFIPLAENSAHIHELGLRVVSEAATAQRALDAAGFGEVVISVNVSGRQFTSPQLMDNILERLAAVGTPCNCFCLEVTETAAMGAISKVADMLSAFRTAGGYVAIDDFGTGLSSLAYLRRLPAHHLKVDRTFVNDIEHGDPAIAAMVIDLARGLGMKVIAEGVETEVQADWLRKRGCQIGQGWLFGRPMPLADLLVWLKARQTEACVV